RPVRADHPYDTAARKPEVHPLEQQSAAEALRDVLGEHHFVPASWPARDDDLRAVELLPGILVQHRRVRPEASLALRLPRARGHAHPLELALERLLTGGRLLLLPAEALLLLLQPRGVVALVRMPFAPVELEDPLGDVIEEVPVVGDGHDRPLEFGEM